MSPELFIILIVFCILGFSYLWLFPRIAGNDLKKLTIYDFMSSVVCVLISGYFFWGLNIEFDAIFTELTWFWFTVLIYLLIEMPLAFWYLKRYRVWDEIK